MTHNSILDHLLANEPVLDDFEDCDGGYNYRAYNAAHSQWERDVDIMMEIDSEY